MILSMSPRIVCLAGILALTAAGAEKLDLEKAVGWSGALPNPLSHQPAGVQRTIRPFWEAWRLVEENYVDRSKVQPQLMTDGAISARPVP